MAAGINSGILYLENFIDNVNTLPSDFGRLLSYIRTLDERCQEKMTQIQEAMDQFVEEYGRADELPPEAAGIRNQVEAMQVELIHFSEEKILVAQLAEDMLQYHLEQLDASIGRLTDDIEANAPLDGSTPPGALFRDSSRSMSGFPDFSLSGLESQDQVLNLRMGVPAVKSQKKVSAPPQRKSPTHTPPQSLGGNVAVPIPSHVARPKVEAAPLSSVMLNPSGNPMTGMVGVGKPGYGQAAPVQPAAPRQFFQPLLPHLQPSAPRPQAPGRVLQKSDINLTLVNKQAELLWPDDGQWYLIQIMHVDLMARTADILYITGETEQGINLDDVSDRAEMMLIFPNY